MGRANFARPIVPQTARHPVRWNARNWALRKKQFWVFFKKKFLQKKTKKFVFAEKKHKKNLKIFF
jgi:hypothetical protein